MATTSSTTATRLRRLLADERGVGIIEVMVSAVVLLVVLAVVLGTLGSASKLSGVSKAKGIAANLAQQDQERLRSLRAAQLANLHQVRAVEVDGVTYEVTSTGTFVSEASQTPGCTSTARADFVKITSTVRSRALGRLRPLHLESLISPAAGSFANSVGGIVVQVRNAAGLGVSGIPVRITGPGTYTQPTSAEGCAFFKFVPSGTYTFSYGVPGWVDQGANTDVVRQATVQSDETTGYQMSYDRAGHIRATFETRVDGEVRPASAQSIFATHPSIPGSGTRSIVAASSAATEIVASDLYPFGSPYGLYSGGCPGNALPAALLGQLPADRYHHTLRVEPGLAYAARLFEPAIDLTVTRGGTPVSGARVFATPSTAGCAGQVRQTTGADGKVSDPGLPYGEWTICADAVLPSGIRSRVSATKVVNDRVDGVKLALAIPDATVESPCV